MGGWKIKKGYSREVMVWRGKNLIPCVWSMKTFRTNLGIVIPGGSGINNSLQDSKEERTKLEITGGGRGEDGDSYRSEADVLAKRGCEKGTV